MARVLAVLSAVFLVGSVALATMQPADVPLGQALFLIDHDLVNVLQTDVDRYLTHALWSYVFVPLLLRPAGCFQPRSAWFWPVWP